MRRQVRSRSTWASGRPRRPRSHAAAGVITALLIAGCSLTGGSSAPVDEGQQSRTVVVATHEAWTMSPQVLEEFTAQTGYRVQIVPGGDAGELTNKLVLTKGSPLADAVYGIDNTFVSRAAEANILEPFTPFDNPGEEHEPNDERVAAQVTPIDFSDVCVNIDDTWFAARDMQPPRTFEDLADPRYRDLVVIPAPPTSSPGLAFLMATVSRFGEDGWEEYWRSLFDNGAKLTAGWADAFRVDFSAGGGDGDRPIVVSYASSPPITIPPGARKPISSALLDTCFRQVEYAAVLKGGRNPDGARSFVQFMVSRTFQEALPENMYVFPVRGDVRLPNLWAKYAIAAPSPWPMPESEIATNRKRWLQSWADIPRP